MGNQSRRKPGTSPESAPSPTRSILSGEVLHEEIAKKAYKLFENRGRIHGHDLDDWLEAEQWVTKELQESLRRVTL